MTDDSTQRIAQALSRLRTPRGLGFGFGFGPGPGPDGHAHGSHAHGSHAHGPHAQGPRGPGPHTHGGRGAGGRFGARWRVLEALVDASAPLAVSEIGERIGVDQPRASRLVQACVDDGFVRRDVDPDDARRALVVLNDTGRELVDRARDQRNGAVAQALADFTADEREQLAVLLARFAEHWPR